METKKKTYLPPESILIEVLTEQGICYSSGEEEKVEGDVNVAEHTEVTNDITFE